MKKDYEEKIEEFKRKEKRDNEEKRLEMERDV